MKLIFLDSAKEDLQDITEYIAASSGNVRTGQQFAQKLVTKCKHIASLPFKMGNCRNDLRPGLRSYAMGNYLILFHCIQNENIIEGHRDVDAMFEE